MAISPTPAARGTPISSVPSTMFGLSRGRNHEGRATFVLPIVGVRSRRSLGSKPESKQRVSKIRSSLPSTIPTNSKSSIVGTCRGPRGARSPSGREVDGVETPWDVARAIEGVDPPSSQSAERLVYDEKKAHR